MTETPKKRGSAPYDLYVDIDGTLLRTDLLQRSRLATCQNRPLANLHLAETGAQGPAPLKNLPGQEKSNSIRPHFPMKARLTRSYRPTQNTQGGRTILITASHQTYARRIAEHLDLPRCRLWQFQPAEISKAPPNCRESKPQQGREFVYAGNSAADRPIWAASKKGNPGERTFQGRQGRDGIRPG